MNKNHQAFNLSEAQIYRLSRAKTEHLVPIASSVPGYIYDRENKTVVLINKSTTARPSCHHYDGANLGASFGFGDSLNTSPDKQKPAKEKLIWQRMELKDFNALCVRQPNLLMWVIWANDFVDLEKRKKITNALRASHFYNNLNMDVCIAICPKNVDLYTTVEQYEKSI